MSCKPTGHGSEKRTKRIEAVLHPDVKSYSHPNNLPFLTPILLVPQIEGFCLSCRPNVASIPAACFVPPAETGHKPWCVRVLGNHNIICTQITPPRTIIKNIGRALERPQKTTSAQASHALALRPNIKGPIPESMGCKILMFLRPFGPLFVGPKDESLSGSL